MSTKIFSKFRNIVVLLCVLDASSSLQAQLPRTSSIVKTYGKLVVPATGIYWGATDTDDNFTGPGGIETVLGRFMAIRRKAYEWDTTVGPNHPPLPTQFEMDNAAQGIIVCVNQRGAGQFPVKFTAPKAGFNKGGLSPGGSWPSTNTAANANGKTGIDRITDGEFDAAFTAQFNGLKGLAGPVIYNFWNEFNGAEHNQFSEAQGAHGTALWSPGSGEIAFRDAYRHVRGLADACGASISAGGNVIFCWVTQGPTAAGWFENYYPGDDYVDFIGMDLYRSTVSDDMNSAISSSGTGDSLIYKFAEGQMTGSSAVGRGTSVKPFIICEAGYNNGVDYNDSGIGGDGLNYRKDSDPNIQAKLLDDFKNRYPDVVIYMTWNVDAAPHMNKVDESPASLSRYITFANDPYCGLSYYTPAHLANISTRMQVGTGDEAAIGGFIVQGAQSKKVILLAIGPSLTRLGVTGALANPTLELHDQSGALIASNDDWQQSPQVNEIIASTVAPSNSRESAIVATLPAGGYTAILRGVSETTGVALLECYELDSNSSRLVNISTRGKVGVGSDVMIGGFIVTGTTAKKVIVCALGPSLASGANPIGGTLANPYLELHDSSGNLIIANDDWTTSPQKSEIIASTVGPTNSQESAVIATLQPGAYTAIVKGAYGGSGIGLVEVFDLDQ
jgi:hypothetical protein